METADKKIWAVSIVMVMLISCGCIGGGPDKTTTTVTSPPEGKTTTTFNEKTTTSTTPSGGVSFESLFNLGKPSGYTVVYDVTASADGKTNKMTQTHYLSGKKFRFDMSEIVGGELSEIRLYNLPKGTYMCVRAQGTWNCIGGKTQEDVETGFDMGDITSEVEADVTKPAYDGTQVIAGVTTQCFKVTIAEGVTRYCTHPNYNMPLLMESTGTAVGQEGYFKSIATSFTLGAPNDSVFELPAEPIDLTEMCRQACLQMPSEYKNECLAKC